MAKYAMEIQEAKLWIRSWFSIGNLISNLNLQDLSKYKPGTACQQGS